MGEQQSGQTLRAYLAPDYLHDIFVTYSHGDFEGTGESELKTWSQRLARKLESELRGMPKFEKTAVFLDEGKRAEHRLDKTLPLTDQIRVGIEGAALLTILMTPHYLESGWCRDEREWWLKHHGKRGDVRGRIFLARVWPTETEKEWPEVLRDERGHPLLGFWFHAREKIDDYAIRPFGWSGRTDDQNEFTNSLLELVGTIARRLEKLREELAERQRVKKDMDRLVACGQILYLHAREAHIDAWSRVANDLRRLGYPVMPSAPEPTAGDPEQLQKIKSERTGLLGDCDALLLLGTADGDALDRDMVAIGHQRRHSARAQSGKQLPCAVLDTVGHPINTEHRIENARNLRIRWIDATQPGWPQAVHEWLVSAGERLRTTA